MWKVDRTISIVQCTITTQQQAMVSALRKAEGFQRFAVSVQYHGSSFWGFSYQGSVIEEDCSLGRSVEGRIREALNSIFGRKGWDNIEPSSRTDRGVHAIKNTFHVDVRTRHHRCTLVTNNNINNNFLLEQDKELRQIIRKLRRGLNFYLHRSQNRQHRKSSIMNEIRILNAVKAPEYLNNPYASTYEGQGQPYQVDWGARFSATERTYVYRLLCTPFNDGADPFEWDRSWCIRQVNHNKSNHDTNEVLDIDGMRSAAVHLQGVHDFSTFRAAHCQRHSPIVNMKSIQIHSQPYGSLLNWNHADPTVPLPRQQQLPDKCDTAKLVLISFTGNSFLYKQVRNLVGCLVQVGRRLLPSEDIPDLLKTKNRSLAPDTAPPHGLFLVDVQHGDFKF